MMGTMELAAYRKPQVTDYGTLMEVTSHMHVHFLGVVNQLVLAAISGPITPNDPGGVAGATGAGGGHGGGGILGLGGSGGKLPFTGLSTILVASIGAALASLGATIRMLMRRKPARQED
jgi:hypothetical protein